MPSKLLRYAHTLRQLRPSQILGRLWYRAYAPGPDLRPPPALRPASGDWQLGIEKTPTLLGATEARFLNEADDISASTIWNDQSKPLLWLYNLHYFDDLTAAGARERQVWQGALINRWIAENPPAAGVGWQPYPTSLRIVNWVKWHLSSGQFNAEMRASLAVQVRHLAKRLEHHILGNHLLANAKALFFAGAVFDGAEAQRWEHTGRRLLEREIREQVLPDGAHFELSPMYHLIVLEDLLDVMNIGRAFNRPLPDGIQAAVQRMVGWSAEMRHPDGDIPFFNDAAFGIAGRPEKLDAYARRLSVTPGEPPAAATMLANSGYARLEAGAGVVIADVAAVGPSYLPGHAHADTLSFELSVHRHRVVVNGGTSVYGTGAERHRQRGTEAHSTVLLDNENSSDVWAGFRVGQRATAKLVRATREGETRILEATHDGYSRLLGQPIHRRTWSLRADGLEVADAVEGRGEHDIACLFHLHPQVTVEREGRDLRLSIPGGRSIVVAVSGDAQVDVVPSTWHPEFGRSIPSRSIQVRRRAILPVSIQTRFDWAA